jgi:SulP family sulfate permease
VSKPTIRRRTLDPRTDKRTFVTDTSLPECPQVRFARIDGSVFFGSVNHIQDTFDLFRSKNPEQKHLAIMAGGINFVDLQGGEALYDEYKRRLADGGGFYLVNVKKGLWDTLEVCGCLDDKNTRNIFQTKGAAVRGIYQKLDKQICAGCTQRIFRECQQEFGS